MRCLMSAAVLGLAVCANAQGVFKVPSTAKFKLASPVGQAPVETRIKLIETLERFRLAPSMINLGGKNYHIAMQTMRDGAWVFSLVPEGKKHFDMAASFPYRALRKTGGYEQDIEGRTYLVRLVEEQGVEAVLFEAKDGGAVATLSTAWIKRQVWESAAPIAAMGPEWRFLFQIDLWIGAGMRTFAFLEKTDAGVVYHTVRAESVDDEPRARIKQVGGRKVSLAVDGEGRLVIKPVEE